MQPRRSLKQRLHESTMKATIKGLMSSHIKHIMVVHLTVMEAEGSIKVAE